MSYQSFASINVVQIKLATLGCGSKHTYEFVIPLSHFWGPYRVTTFDGHRYFLTVVDDFTRMSWVFLLKVKSDVCVVIQQFLTQVQTQFDKLVKIVRSDNGTEFVNSTCGNMFNKLA